MTQTTPDAEDLRLLIDNDRTLYDKVWTPITKKLSGKKADGTYDRDKAAIAYGYLVIDGARQYEKENPGTVVTAAVKRETAESLRDEFEIEHSLGNYTHNLKTCSECGSLIDASEIGEKVAIYVCLDCDATILFPPATTRGACPYVFRCNECGALTEYDIGRYSCNNSDCENFNRTKRPEDIDFGDYYINPLLNYGAESQED